MTQTMKKAVVFLAAIGIILSMGMSSAHVKDAKFHSDLLEDLLPLVLKQENVYLYIDDVFNYSLQLQEGAERQYAKEKKLFENTFVLAHAICVNRKDNSIIYQRGERVRVAGEYRIILLFTTPEAEDGDYIYPQTTDVNLSVTPDNVNTERNVALIEMNDGRIVNQYNGVELHPHQIVFVENPTLVKFKEQYRVLPPRAGYSISISGNLRYHMPIDMFPTDLDENSKIGAAYKYLRENRFFHLDRKVFQKDARVTRMELVQYLYDFEGEPSVAEKKEKIYSDIKELSDVHQWAYATKLILGNQRKEFMPDAELNLQDAMVIIHRYLEIAGVADRFGDKANHQLPQGVGDYAKKAVTFMVNNGLTEGLDIKSVKTPATREQITILFSNILKQIQMWK